MNSSSLHSLSRPAPAHPRRPRWSACGGEMRASFRRFPAVTDPTERDAKLAPFGATRPGISGVELLLPLAMTLVKTDLLGTCPTLLAQPRRRFLPRPCALPAGNWQSVARRTSCCSTRQPRPWPVKPGCPRARTAQFIGHGLPGLPCATPWSMGRSAPPGLRPCGEGAPRWARSGLKMGLLRGPGGASSLATDY